MCIFKEGDVVWFTERGFMDYGYVDGRYGCVYAIGTVKGIFQIIPCDCIEYEVVAEGDDDSEFLVIDEAWMGKADPHDFESDGEVLLGKPLFQMGDVVVAGDFNDIQVVREIIIVKTGEMSKYMYEVSPLDSDDQVCAYGEDLLELLYHDSTWEEYFTKYTQNDLPEWKGEIYNLDRFRRGADDYFLRRDYDNDTLPPDRLGYIYGEYSIECRIEAVFYSRKNAREVEEILHLEGKELYEIERSIIEKIDNRNADDVNQNFKKEVNDRRKFRFTDLELSVVSEADKRDVVFGQLREHYPVEMTKLQIMQAVKDAYSTAHKISKRKVEKARLERYHLYDKSDPVKGSALYEGVSKDGLVIRFWYNFDLNLIETAYPVRMNLEKVQKQVLTADV